MRGIILLNLLGKLVMNDEITNLKKIEWVHWVLDEISQGTTMDNGEIEQARDFIEDIRELFIWDMK
jgi:phosphatidylethanolamine-binding protein (PEBP) family uncharacterized protein